uniref:Uncharacterized protein n=1 Tax=Rhizophora mucronata TaxID=61149 RepID=A0A2P2LLU4_RHIMU
MYSNEHTKKAPMEIPKSSFSPLLKIFKRV